MRKLRANLTYANLTATLALILALGGASAYAANQLAPKSVGEKQLRSGAITPDKIRKNAITSPKIPALAVKEGKLAGDAVSATKLANSSVNTEKLPPDSRHRREGQRGHPGPGALANTANSASFAESANPAAFAKVDKAGNLDTVNSKNIAAATELEAGVYCVTVSGFSPRGAQVTPIFNGIGSSDAFARIGGRRPVLPRRWRCSSGTGGESGGAVLPGGLSVERALRTELSSSPPGTLDFTEFILALPGPAEAERLARASV
jgi:hypothetical protein